jgi:hypothetical protein
MLQTQVATGTSLKKRHSGHNLLIARSVTLLHTGTCVETTYKRGIGRMELTITRNTVANGVSIVAILASVIALIVLAPMGTITTSGTTGNSAGSAVPGALLGLGFVIMILLGVGV